MDNGRVRADFFFSRSAYGLCIVEAGIVTGAVLGCVPVPEADESVTGGLCEMGAYPAGYGVVLSGNRVLAFAGCSFGPRAAWMACFNGIWAPPIRLRGLCTNTVRNAHTWF